MTAVPDDHRRPSDFSKTTWTPGICFHVAVTEQLPNHPQALVSG